MLLGVIFSQVYIRLEPVWHNVRICCEGRRRVIGFLYKLILILKTDVFRNSLRRGRLYANHISSISWAVRTADDVVLTIGSSCRRLCEVEEILARENS